MGITFSLFGCYLLRHAVRNLGWATTSEHWPETRGQLTKVQLWGKRRVAGEMHDAQNLSVNYEFEVAGKPFRASRIAFYSLVYPETLTFAEKHPNGSELSVFYDPENPENCALVRGVRADNKRWVLFSNKKARGIPGFRNAVNLMLAV